MATQLIQELVGLCASKGIYVIHDSSKCEVRFISAMPDIKYGGMKSKEKLQAAIEKVKQL